MTKTEWDDAAYLALSHLDDWKQSIWTMCRGLAAMPTDGGSEDATTLAVPTSAARERQVKESVLTSRAIKDQITGVLRWIDEAQALIAKYRESIEEAGEDEVWARLGALDRILFLCH
jgi:hypothetical protein